MSEDHVDIGDIDVGDHSEDANAADEVHDVAAECNFDGC